MKLFKTLTRPIAKALEDYKRAINRPNMPCDFTEGISREDLREFVAQAVNSIKGKKIEISVKEAVIRGLVQSNTGLSTWMFSIDYNDYGHITGKYWLRSENDDSPVPQVIAKKIRDAIELKLIKGELEGPQDEYICPRCGAVLNEQEGFDPDNQSWVCKICGQQLTGDDLQSDVFGDVVWYCDQCGAILNRQEGFTEEAGTWQCTECGFKNDVTADNIQDGSLFN